MTEGHKSEKLRLNITVDKNVVEKAKEMGFNISGTFEEFLKVLTHRPSPDYEDILRAHNDFLQRVQFILSHYDPGLEVEIGKYPDWSYVEKTSGYDKEDVKRMLFHSNCKIFLDLNTTSTLKDGKHYANMNIIEEGHFLLEPNDMQFLYPPEKILLNLVSEIKKVAVNNEKEIQKLNLAKKLINALFNDISSSESGSATPHLRRILEDAESKEERIESIQIQQDASANSPQGNKETILVA
jgi:hypothetical protein